jgi:U3 small nucleolar ribonucleoprotein protein IMP3
VGDGSRFEKIDIGGQKPKIEKGGPSLISWFVIRQFCVPFAKLGARANCWRLRAPVGVRVASRQRESDRTRAAAMRELKHHERKLLKKVDFLSWKSERGHREVATIRRYHLRDRDEFKRYNKLCGNVTKLVSLLSKLDARDSTRVEVTEGLLKKLYDIGATPSEKSLALCDRLSTSSFCRRRLAVICVRLRMCETLREATTFVEQGHVKVGANVIRDPGYIVTREMEDYVTWVDTSKIRRKVAAYNDKLDDFDLLGE